MNALPFIKNNLEALATVKNPAAFWLAHQRPDEQAAAQNIITNRWGLLDWRLPDGKSLFEAFPPQAHYRSWASDAKNPEGGATVIVGCNIGYGLNHVLVNTPNNHKVLVVEPEPGLLLACLGQTDYSPYIQARKLHFLPPDKKIITDFLRGLDMQFLFGRIHLRLDVPSQQIGPQYAQWGGFCKATMENFAVEMTTLRKRQDTMVRNELENFRRAFADGSVKNMPGSASGVTAVIIGAGPSLEDFGPQLAQNPAYTLYATALQTLPSLQRLGMKPHLAMAIDYSKGMLALYERLDKEWAKDIPLLYSTKVDPEVLRRYPGPTIPIWTLGGVGTYAMKESDNLLDAAGNVSVALYRFLHSCGVSRFVLCGQDFAWRTDKSHAPGHHARNRTITKVQRLKNLHGETIHSTLSYISALRDLEADIDKNKTPTFNIYGGNAVIKGTRNIDVQTAMDQGLLCSAPGSLERFLSALRAARTPRTPPAIEPRYPSWSSSLRNAQKRFEKLFKKAHSKQKEIRETLGRFHAYLRHDPLYLPYLYNEITDVAGLLHGGRTLGQQDFVAFKHIVERIRKKVREMDELTATPPLADAARNQAA